MSEDKKRRRMVVEEVQETAEIKEKVEELQEITQDISESVEKSEKIQEEIAEVVDSVNIETPEKEEDKPQEEPEPMPVLKRDGGPNALVIIIPGIFLLGALLGGIYFYQASVNTQKSVSTPTPTPVEVTVTTATPVASPAAAVDLTKYQINIMNGSGIVGEAGKVKTVVETAGFKVGKTGNAATYDFTKTVIKAKADVPAEFIAKLSTALLKSYVLDTNAVLPLSSPDSVQIIVGSTKAK